MRVSPKTLTVEPNRARFRNENVLPKWQKSSTDTEDANRVMPNTERLDPSRENERTLKDDPMCALSRREIADPMRKQP
jgi:hypothetical protein